MKKFKNNNIFLKQYQEYKDLINNRLEKIIDKNDESCVAQAMRYSLNIGGKRIRPILTLAFCELCSGLKQEALDIACAIEMIHTYSLIHDDLPCIDNDDMRRGKPSCHIKFGQAVALLAGDGLLTDAFNLISKSNLESDIKINIIKILSEAIGSKKMIFGQELDINKTDKISLESLDKINKLKTCELIKVSAILGCIVAKTDKNKILVADKFGEILGQAFQIKDDIIDVTGDQKLIGKPVLSDRNSGKITYIDLVGKRESEKKVEDFSKQAINILKKEFEGNLDFLIDLTDFLLNRES